MSDLLLADDAIYEEFYDVRNEAEHLGNLIDEDMGPQMSALRDRGAVQKGHLRELLGLPEAHRYQMTRGRETWTCFSFEACNAAFRDNASFSSTILARPGETERGLGMIEMDDPEHRSYRDALQPMFLRPRAFSWWRENWIDEIVGALIDRLRGSDRAELNLQLCARLPVHTVTRATGVEGDSALAFRRAMLLSRWPFAAPEQRVENAAIVDTMLQDLIDERRREPRDDIVSRLLAGGIVAPEGGTRPMTDREILIHVRLVMLAGGGTSWRQFGILLWALLTHRDQLEDVRADRKLIDRAIEESLRWNPTDPVFSRLAVKDADLAGTKVPEGAVLEICLGAANRDPARWDDPDRFDIHRPPQSHLGFGMGTHQCLGMNVARSEISAGLNALLDHFPALRLDPDAPPPRLTGGLEQRGMSALHVLLR